MKIRTLIYILLFAVMMTSCHSHKAVVVRADDSRDSGGKRSKTELPVIVTKADNKYTKALLDEAYGWIGTPYVYGGNTKDGVDCSGFVLQVYLKALDIKLPRVSREQGDYCKKIDKKELYPGDLVFFITGNGSKVNHVGMYVGDGKMIHASSKGVMVSDLSLPYWIQHYHHSGVVESYRKMVKGKK